MAPHAITCSFRAHQYLLVKASGRELGCRKRFAVKAALSGKHCGKSTPISAAFYGAYDL
jgi:hypothetical protein